MAEEKRYYWLKLKEDFFNSKRIKKLRNMAGGDTYTIIYLKMQLLALKTEGILTWTGLEEKFADELALDLNEKPDDVAVTLMYLLNTGLAETQDDSNIFLPWVIENTGSETSAAERMRKMRGRNNVTSVLQERYTEIETDIETDIEPEKKKEPAHKRGEYGWVKLTDAQYEKLLKDLGQEELDRCIRYVDESAQKTHNKNGWTDWNLVIRNCSRDRWGLDRREQKPKQYTTAAEYQSPKKINADQLRRLREDFGV